MFEFYVGTAATGAYLYDEIRDALVYYFTAFFCFCFWETREPGRTMVGGKTEQPIGAFLIETAAMSTV